MSFVKLTVVSALATVAMALAGCGAVTVKPSGHTASGAPASRGRVDDARVRQADHVRCLRTDKFPVEKVGASDLLVAGTVRVHFAPTTEAALDQQIEDREQGAEVIGSALMYPGSAPDTELTKIENCLASGVHG